MLQYFIAGMSNTAKKSGLFFLRERHPGRWVVAFHAGPVFRDGVPHLVPGLEAQVSVNDAWQHDKPITLELSYLAGGQEVGLGHGGRRHCSYSPD